MKLFKTYKTFDEILPSFMIEKEIELKHRTFINYVSKTGIFSRWLYSKNFSKLPLRKISSEIMAEFFIYLAKDKHLDRPTVIKYFLIIRSVFQFAAKRGETERLPFELITYPAKKDDMSAEVISPDHLKILLPAIKERDPQLYLAVMIEYYCFIRPGTELRLMKVKDIDLDQGLIQVTTSHAKNGHKRIVTMPLQLIELCIEYGIHEAEKELYVFGKHKKIEDRPLSINMFAWRFNKIRDEFKLTKRYKLYSFKHTGATALHNSNMVSLRGLMDQRGHSRLEATQHYVKKHAGFINRSIRESFPSPM